MLNRINIVSKKIIWMNVCLKIHISLFTLGCDEMLDFLFVIEILENKETLLRPRDLLFINNFCLLSVYFI